MITVLLVDDHAILLDGLRFLLEAQGDIQVIATASNGQDGVDLAIQHCPDVVVMDISMPVMNGIDATKLISKKCKNTKVAILSMHHTTEFLQRALEAGALGYVLKDAAGTELVTAIRALHAGKSFLSQRVSRS